LDLPDIPYSLSQLNLSEKTHVLAHNHVSKIVGQIDITPIGTAVGKFLSFLPKLLGINTDEFFPH